MILPRITGRDLQEVARAEKSAAGGLDGWAWNQIKALPTLPGQRPFSVLPVVYRLWASLRLGRLKEWVVGWVPMSVFSLGNGVSSVGAWFSTALDIEEVLAQIGGDKLKVMVADVIKSFYTVDRSTLDCALGRLGLPSWLWRVYFACHSQVRLRFKSASFLGEP